MPIVDMLPLFLFPAVLVCALFARPRSARAEAPVSGIHNPLLLAMPVPVMVINAETMRLHAVNTACVQTLGATCTPGTHISHLFATADKVEEFLAGHGLVQGHAPLASNTPANAPSGAPTSIPAPPPGTASSVNELACIWKDSVGRHIPVVITLFFIERHPDEAPLLFLTVDANATVASTSLRRCFDAFPEMLFFKDVNGRFLLCNTAFERMCGRPLPEIQGKTVAELGLPHPLDSLLCVHDADVLQVGMPFFSEMSIVTDEGKILSFESQTYPDIAADGTIHGIFGACRDISLAKATAEALQRQGALLQAANDAALMLFSDEEELDDVAWQVLGTIGEVTGADRVDVWRNHGSSEEGMLCTQVYSWTKSKSPHYFSPHSNTAIYSAHLPGWEEQLASGQCVNTLTHKSTRQQREHLANQGISAALAAPIIFRSTFWGFIRLGIIQKENLWSKGEEAILRSVGLLLAATMQRRQIQEALSESEQRFRDVTMAAGEIVWELDAQGYFSYISERVLILTGFSPQEVRGMRWEDFAVDGHGEEMTGRMFQASVPTGSFRALEHRIRGKDGNHIWLFTSGKLLTGPEGIAGLRGTSLDITHDKQTSDNLNTTLQALEHANKELENSAKRAHQLASKAESASKAKSEFLANMSHEIRTPLNAIIGMAYLAQKTDLSPRQSDYVGKIHTAGISLLGVVNDILDFSKIESGKLEIEHLPFDLDKLFENLASITGAKAEEQGLDVAFIIRHDVPRLLMGDALRLGQVLTNLVGNAVKFTEKGGISLHCLLDKLESGPEGSPEDRKAHLRFIVRDTGIGIPENQQEKLFESFSQVDSSITRKYGGTGLGLVIAKNLLELSGGSLSLKSTPGEGTEITVSIALDVDTAASGVSGGPVENPLQDVHVLVVDPSRMQRELLLEMLQDMGCRATAFADIGEGFAAVASADESPDPCKIIIMPQQLVEEGKGRNLTHLQEAMHLSFPPHIVSVVPFGSAGETTAVPSHGAHQKVSAVIARPVLSSLLHTTLSEIITGPGPAELAGEAKPQSYAPYFPGSRVLLVEDNSVNQQIATELLREVGITVTIADNGRIAVELLENSPIIPFDLIFMDLQMPEMDGFTATARIRSNPRLAGLPIIAMTAHATVEERNRCLEAGMNEHISKPIDVEALHTTLGKWLKSAQKQMLQRPCTDSGVLPELPGLSVQEAIQRLGGDQDLYRTLLLQFCLHHSKVDHNFSAAMAAGDTAEAMRILHTIKGLAGSLGAKRLAAVTIALEERLELSPASVDDSVLLPFLTELSTLIGMLHRAFPEPSGNSHAPAENAVDTKALVNDLAKLNSLLRDDDAEACVFFSTLEPLLKAVDSPATATAARALAVFDFSTALSVLGPMEKGLAATQTGEEE